jgi:hypothetical protein
MSIGLGDLPLFIQQRVRLDPPSVSVDTSEAAADAILPHLTALRERVYRYVAAQGSYGATCGEVCRALQLDGNTVRPRLWELEGARLIRKTQAVRLTASRRWACVYCTT